MARKPKSRTQIAFLSMLGAWFLRLLFLTLRKQFAHYQIRKDALEHSPTGNAIYAIWHGRIVLATCAGRHTGIRALISLHGDGELIARVAQKLGFHALRGSSSRGGTEGLLASVNTLKAGHDLVITPDGPRGPCFHVHDGCLFAARRSGVPIIPVGYSASRFWQINSWDGTMIPKPFAKVQITLGAPIHVPPNATDEQLKTARSLLQERLMAVTQEGDAAICKTLPSYEPRRKSRRRKEKRSDSKQPGI